MKKKKLISISISAYNEEENIKPLSERLVKLFEVNEKYDFEAVIVDNGSIDNTYDELKKISEKDSRFKVVRLSRNFGAEGGMCAGLRHVKGDAAVIMHADLEEPPELATKFIEKWEEGYKNVYGIIKRRQGNFIRRMNSKIFYWLINKLTGNIIPKFVGDYRLVDKDVYKVVANMPERNRFQRGMFAWSGFPSIGIEYDRDTRQKGESKATSLHVISYALSGIFMFSDIPLKISSLFGMLMSFFSFLGIVYFAVISLVLGRPVPGFATIVCLNLLLFGFLFVLIGILSEYVSMIFREVKGRPVFVVSEKIGFNDDKSDK